MPEIQKGRPSPGTIIGLILAATMVGLVCSTIKGSRDGCEARGDKPQGLECIKEDGK